MKHPFTFLFLFLVFVASLPAQSYESLRDEGWDLYEAGDYQASLDKYLAAYEFEDKTTASDLYNGACSAALAGASGTALELLEKARQAGWVNVRHLKKDSDLNTLHTEPEWDEIVGRMQADLDAIEANYDKELQAELLNIFEEDQGIRRVYIDKANELGWEHPVVDSLGKIMAFKDSVNLERVTTILDEHGWVSRDLVGGQAAQAQFLVIQHAPLEVQQKYLSLMQEAAEQGELRKSSLALLLDRIALREGRKQIYGSQIGRNPETDEQYVLPLEDPVNVDARRAEMGLPPLADYVDRWGIVWDPAEYLERLPEFESWNFDQ